MIKSIHLNRIKSTLFKPSLLLLSTCMVFQAYAQQTVHTSTGYVNQNSSNAGYSQQYNEYSDYYQQKSQASNQTQGIQNSTSNSTPIKLMPAQTTQINNANYASPQPINSSYQMNMRKPMAGKVSFGRAMGLNRSDALSLNSSVALVVDQQSNQILYEKNSHAVLPIASITKLMTALVVLDARLPMDEVLTIGEHDVDKHKFTSSRLKVGQRLTRQELILLALMSSENRAASALGHNYPGGINAFISAMNQKAKSIGMNETYYVDSSGLSNKNRSSAYDLGRLVAYSSQYPVIRSFSTHNGYQLYGRDGNVLSYQNTNRLVRGGEWQIGLQKTGFINEAGKCLVMQAQILGRPVIMVFLDAASTTGRFLDANRVKDWLEGKLS